MLVQIALAKSGSPERWDALPKRMWDKAKEGKALKADGKKKKRKKIRKNGLIDTGTKGAETVISDVIDQPRFQ